MKRKTKELSAVGLKRLRAQGYTSQSDQELCQLAFGNRFAYQSCVTILIIGVTLSSIPILTVMTFVALLGVILPNHPFDYLYNLVLSKRMKKPQLPPRSAQLKFACTIATLWIGTTTYLFYQGMMISGYVIGGLLIGTVMLVATIDFCVPSIVYNALFSKQRRTTSQIKV